MPSREEWCIIGKQAIYPRQKERRVSMITADMSIASVMQLDPEVAPVFMSFGMHCLYCPHASAESIRDASAVHGIDADELVKALNAYFDAKK